MRGLDLLSALEFTRLRKDRDAVKRVIGSLPEEDRALLANPSSSPPYLVRATRWYPFALQCRLLHAIADELAGGELDVLFEAGKHQARRDVPTVFQPMLKLRQPGWLVSLGTRVWRLYHDRGRWELERTPGELIARLLDHPEADEAFCVAFSGWVTGALELSGATEVVSSHPVCQARGGQACVHTVRWSVG